MYLFDLVDFNEDGEVCASKLFDENHTKANYLYLVSKYNQKFLDMQGLKVPEFFKNELAGILAGVEMGDDFEKAKKIVISNCLPKVKMMERESDSDKEFIASMNEFVSYDDKKFKKDIETATNGKHNEYIITATSGQILDSVFKNLQNPENLNDKILKSKIYKDVISYNGLMASIEKVGTKDNAVSDVKVIA